MEGVILTEEERKELYLWEKADHGLLDIVQHRRLDTSPNLIYHYCSAETLLSILENKTLRFSDASGLNDGEEIIWAEKQFLSAIRRLRDREDVPEELPSISKKFEENFIRLWGEISGEARHFLSCFSLTGDSLSQWRAYADDAQGFAIGFCVNDLDVPAKIIAVDYDIDKQQQEIMSLIIKLSEISKVSKNYFDTEQSYHDFILMFSTACAYKNPALRTKKKLGQVAWCRSLMKCQI